MASDGGCAQERVILHLDCNNFFASVELLSHLELRDRPVAVAGDTESRHGIILAKNMPAKRMGVVTAETVWQAQRKCPGLVLLSPHHDEYARISRQINRLYLDVTDQVEPFSIDESFLDVTGSRTLFGDGPAIADLLRRRVREKTGITVSCGVSFNKTWAKMGSDYRKPDATTVVSRETAGTILYPQKVDNMLFVGAAAARVLHENGIHTIGQLACADPRLLLRLLGKGGVSLSRAARGEDDSPVRVFGEGDPARSVSHARTFSRDLVGREACERELLPLCEAVGTRLRRLGVRARTVQLQVKSPDFRVTSRQHTLSLPTASTERIFREACSLYAEACPEDTPVRLFSVGAENLVSMDESVPVQLSFLEDSRLEADTLARDARRERLEQAVDRVRERYGEASILRGRVRDRP